MNLLAVIGYGSASVAFLGLMLLLLTGWRGRLEAFHLLGAVAASAVWALLSSLHAGTGYLDARLVWAVEVVRNLLWVLFLLRLLQPLAEGSSLYTRLLGSVRIAALLLAVLICAWLVETPRLEGDTAIETAARAFPFVGQLLFAVLGLMLVEQLFRNTPVEQRWGVKYLCIGLGVLFVFDFYFYSDAVLFYRVDETIWSARGFVIAMVVPLIGVTAARNPNWSTPLFVSRRMVLHSTTLFAAGIYMLVMAMVGYYIRMYGGEWGNVLQIAFLGGAVIILMTLLFSDQFRGHAKVFFNKHFFHYRYDYRDEWLRVISLLSGLKGELPLPERVILTLAEIVESPGGLLWLKSQNGDYQFQARFNTQSHAEPVVTADDVVVQFLIERRWVVDVDEMEQDSELYDHLPLAEWLGQIEDAWLVVPLIHDDGLTGFVILLQPRVAQSINWENLDLLKTIGVQAASYLALNQAAEALVEARRFEGFNRLSAFVMHDLKNLVAQLSLVAKNATKHRNNPAFIDDAMATINNAVDKMNRLMVQLKGADVTGVTRRVELVAELRGVVEAKSEGTPPPVFDGRVDEIWVMAEPDRLSAVLGHVIQNAQDATPPEGQVKVVLRASGDHAVVDVIDTGTGMDADFINSRLFRPFDTTKGLTGMGIGAYECREVINALGGQCTVESEPGHGTLFRIMLPLISEQDEAADNASTLEEVNGGG